MSEATQAIQGLIRLVGQMEELIGHMRLQEINACQAHSEKTRLTDGL